MRGDIEQMAHLTLIARSYLQDQGLQNYLDEEQYAQFKFLAVDAVNSDSIFRIERTLELNSIRNWCRNLDKREVEQVRLLLPAQAEVERRAFISEPPLACVVCYAPAACFYWVSGWERQRDKWAVTYYEVAAKKRLDFSYHFDAAEYAAALSATEQLARDVNADFWQRRFANALSILSGEDVAPAYTLECKLIPNQKRPLFLSLTWAWSFGEQGFWNADIRERARLAGYERQAEQIERRLYDSVMRAIMYSVDD
jgi:hypothetical protein